MKINKFNKKSINNLILGSFLFGASASIISQVQATQRSSVAKKNTYEYNPKATERLRELCSKPETLLDECIKLVRDEKADPNVEAGSLTLLEEAVLRQSTSAVEVLIEKGASIYRITEKQVVDGREYGRTLLHLAVYPPQKVQKLLNKHKWKKIYNGKNKNPVPLSRQEAPAPEIAEKEALKKELYNLPINDYITRMNSWTILDHSPLPPMVEILLNHGLGKEEINMQKTPSGQSPLDIARSNSGELLKLLFPTYGLKDVTDSNRDKLLKLLEAKIKAKRLLPFHEAIKERYDKIINLFETKSK
ncbi:MAG: hypothetical protein LBQ03_00295 [Puniceicoccales bacterium]|jgi:hypothetical protein|nr:hypothetical protein [Puniceicoccales bacterium]